jgi:hypothetical protein
MLRSILTVVLFAAVLGAPAFALGQDTRPEAFAVTIDASQLDPAEMTVAREIATLLGARDVYLGVYSRAKIDTGLFPGRQAEFTASLQKVLAPTADKFPEAVAVLYAVNFSPAELAEIVGFLKTAAGRKLEAVGVVLRARTVQSALSGDDRKAARAFFTTPTGRAVEARAGTLEAQVISVLGQMQLLWLEPFLEDYCRHVECDVSTGFMVAATVGIQSNSLNGEPGASILQLPSLRMAGAGGMQVGGKDVRATFADPAAAALAGAACRGDAGQIAGSAGRRALLNAVGENGMTPLLWAMSCENLVGIEALLKAGADPNQVTLFEAGVTPSLESLHRASPVFRAAMMRNSTVLRLLLANGGRASAWDYYEGSSLEATALEAAMELALETGRWDNYRALLTGGADAEMVDGFGRSIAVDMAFKGQYALIAELLEGGYDCNLADLPSAMAVGDRPMTPDRQRVEALLSARGVQIPPGPRVQDDLSGCTVVEWPAGMPLITSAIAEKGDFVLRLNDQVTAAAVLEVFRKFVAQNGLKIEDDGEPSRVTADILIGVEIGEEGHMSLSNLGYRNVVKVDFQIPVYPPEEAERGAVLAGQFLKAIRQAFPGADIVVEEAGR